MGVGRGVPLVPQALVELLALVGAPVRVAVVLHDSVVAHDVELTAEAVVGEPLLSRVLDRLVGLVGALAHVAVVLTCGGR